MRLLDRLRGLLLAPRATWDAIAAEGDTTRWLWRRYLPALVLIQAVGVLIEFLLMPRSPEPSIRTTERFQLRPDGSLEHIGTGTSTIVELHPALQLPVLALATFLLMSLFAVIARWLILRAAPSYGAQPDRAAATALAIYAQTGPAVAGLFTAVPWVGPPLAMGGVIHTLVLFHLGAPRLLAPAPEERQRFARVAVYRAIASGLLLLVLFVFGTLLFGFLMLPLLGRLAPFHPAVMT